MKLFLIQCDNCTQRDHMKYNGEHWLAPQNWVQLYDDFNAKDLDKHLCPICNPVFKPEPSKQADTPPPTN